MKQDLSMLVEQFDPSFQEFVNKELAGTIKTK
jgi:hypothetical protein